MLTHTILSCGLPQVCPVNFDNVKVLIVTSSHLVGFLILRRLWRGGVVSVKLSKIVVLLNVSVGISGIDLLGFLDITVLGEGLPAIPILNVVELGGRIFIWRALLILCTRRLCLVLTALVHLLVFVMNMVHTDIRLETIRDFIEAFPIEGLIDQHFQTLRGVRADDQVSVKCAACIGFLVLRKLIENLMQLAKCDPGYMVAVS